MGNATPAPLNLATLAEEAIEVLRNDTWMAHVYRPEAPTRMEAYPQMQLQIHKEAMARASIASMDQELRIKRANVGEADSTQRYGSLYEVTDPNGQKYRSTYFRVTLQYPLVSFRVAQLGCRICAALRAQYIERSMNDSCEVQIRSAGYRT